MRAVVVFGASVWGVCEGKLQLLELLSHNGDKDAARINQQVSRSILFFQIGWV
jgi:hypothetical protein